MREQLEELIEQIKYHQRLYDEGNPIISDEDFDIMYFQLVELEKESGIILDNSPTRSIIYEVRNELVKVTHNHPMLSLDKTKNIEGIRTFLKGKPFIGMFKLDGLTLSLLYEDGKLVRAETRGNGYEGEDVTHNARIVKNIPSTINQKGTFVIDGEIMCSKKVFEEKFAGEYKSPRNLAAGSIRLLNSKECEKRELSFFAWDIIKSEVAFETLGEKLAFLASLKFDVVPFRDLEDQTLEDTVSWLDNKKAAFDFPLDGYVFKYNNCADYDAAGKTEHHYSGGMAYKFYDEEYETELLDIEWTMGRTGVLTPVAIYKDIEIDGAVCNRASLHNVSVMKELLGCPYEGQKVWVYRSNMIIPQIAKATRTNNDVTPIEIPSVCPICGGDTALRTSVTGTVDLVCENPQCSGKLINQLDHFCGIKGLNIKGLSKATLEKLIDWGRVTSYVDIFLLHSYAAEWAQKPGFGEKSVEKILTAIEEAKHCDLASFISALGIPLIGRAVSKDIAAKVDNYWQFRKLIENNYDFTQWDGFGEEKKNSLLKYDYCYADYVVQQGFVVIQEPCLDEPVNQGLSGKTFVITGKLNHYKNRNLLKEEIEKLGGKVTDSISAKTSYLINNDINSASSKNKKAKELNIPIITEEDFISMKNF